MIRPDSTQGCTLKKGIIGIGRSSGSNNTLYNDTTLYAE